MQLVKYRKYLGNILIKRKIISSNPSSLLEQYPQLQWLKSQGFKLKMCLFSRNWRGVSCDVMLVATWYYKSSRHSAHQIKKLRLTSHPSQVQKYHCKQVQARLKSQKRTKLIKYWFKTSQSNPFKLKFYHNWISKTNADSCSDSSQVTRN